ncbi:S8 family serine peptidase [Persicitalea sp.]|uniref:S8 family peptidase n=1 Tax=Persicitalea sp. TaxID=3100273 RepID=UPI003593FA7D
MTKPLHRFRVISCTIVALLIASFAVQAQTPADVKAAARAAKVSTDLLTVIENNGINTQAPFPGGLQRDNLFMTEGNSIAISAVANSEQEGQALLQSLQALGLTKGRVYKQQVTGYLPIDKLDDLKDVSVLRSARPSYKPIHNVGSVTSQADTSLRSYVARTTYNVDGTGVKIGVLSDSYNTRGGAAAGVASGDLPAGVEVLKEFSGTGIDEGRAMIELIHDIAPGSPQAFYTAFEGQLDFAAGIRALAAAGCKVITDDVGYFAAPFFQDGPVAQAVDDVVNNSGVTYFSSAGNSARQSYQSAYRGTTQPASPGYYVGAHDFGGGDKFQSLTIGAGRRIIISFQWDDPFFSVSGGSGARTDMDLLVYFNGNFLGNLSSQGESIGGDPVEIIGLTNTGGSAVTIELVLAKYEDETTGPTPDPTLVKWVNFGNNVLTEYDTKSSTVTGHSNASRAIAVGAAPFYNTPAYNPALTTATIEPFSSAGGTPILFSTDGTRLSTPIVRQKPEITSVDGTNNTFFGNDTSRDPDAFPNFFGTSAAAPHAAGVAALMKQKVPGISPAVILSTLESTALDMDDPFTPGFDAGFDFGTGYGFIQADRALKAITPANPTITITGVTTISCSPIPGNPNKRLLTFTPQYSNSNGQPITFSVASEKLPTTAPGPYTLEIYIDNPKITLKASQPGAGETSFVYNWLAACGTTPPPPGPDPQPTTFAITGVTTVSCSPVPGNPNKRSLTFTPQYSGVNGQPITFSVVSEKLPTTAPGPYTLEIYTDNPTITLKATQQGTGGETIFVYNWLAACGTTPPPPGPDPQPTTFAITDVTTISCSPTPGNSNLRLLTFTPKYSGVNGQPITFSIVREKLPTTVPGPYTLSVYIDNPTITLKATQQGTSGEVSFVYNWLAVCGNSGARFGVGPDEDNGLNVLMLGNPVEDGRVSVLVRGVANQPVSMTLTDTQGKVLGSHQIEQAGREERHVFEVSRQPTSLLLLKVSTPTETKTIKVLKVQ